MLSSEVGPYSRCSHHHSRGQGQGFQAARALHTRVMAFWRCARAGNQIGMGFPSGHASGHVEATTLKKQHEAAIEAAEVSRL